jgi:hypothetical protein
MALFEKVRVAGFGVFVGDVLPWPLFRPRDADRIPGGAYFTDAASSGR